MRDPSSIAIGIVLPVILILLFGYGLSLDVKDVPVAIVLEDPSADARELAAGFQLSPYFHADHADVDAASGAAHARPQGRRHRPHPIRLLPPVGGRRRRGAGAGVTAPTPTMPASSKAMRRARSANGRRGAPPRASESPAAGVTVASRLWFNEANDSHYFLVPGLIVLVMTLIGALLTALVMAREWERGTLEALFVTPVRADEILLGKMIPYFVLGMVGLALVRRCRQVPVPRAVARIARRARRRRRCSICWSPWASGLLISSADQEPVRRQPDHAAGDVPAGDDAVGLPVRPAQRAARRSG